VAYTEAAPKRGLDVSDCVFYHSVDLPSGPQAGIWDLRGRFDEYIGHQQLDGRTVLDVGTATGFLSFEAESRGAQVTSFDARSAALWHELPIPGTQFVDDHPAWLQAAERWYEGIRNSYWLCHEELASTARYLSGDVYELEGDQYEVVVMGQILVHLRDAISALAAAARVCADTLIVVEGSMKDKAPIAGLCGRAGGEITQAWYHYSHGWYREVLAILGFRDVKITSGVYRCNDALHPRKIELATVAATR